MMKIRKMILFKIMMKIKILKINKTKMMNKKKVKNKIKKKNKQLAIIIQGLIQIQFLFKNMKIMIKMLKILIQINLSKTNK